MKKIIVLVLMLASSNMAIAMPGMDKKPAQGLSAKEKYEKMDINKDSKVDVQEFKTTYPTMNDVVFGMIDIDKDNNISLDEWQTFQEKHMQGMKEEEQKKNIKNNTELLIMPPKGN